MVVEVDDSGWGDLLGGTIIVMRRIGTNERYVGEVPVEAFQGEEFKVKAYLLHALRIVREGVEVLKITKDESILVCSGYILSEVRKVLANDGYKVTSRRIIGITQEFAEDEYIRHLSHLGVGTTDQARRLRGFDNSLSWVLRDVDKREHLVKTGWKAWPKLKSGDNDDSKQAKK